MTPEDRLSQIQTHQAAIKESQILPAERLAKIQAHRDEITKLTDECPHTFRPLTEKELTDKWMSVSSGCLGCGQYFGWRCKKSPDGVCHYFSEDGKIELIDGTTVPVAESHDPDYETDDGCLFCGMPDERK